MTPEETLKMAETHNRRIRIFISEGLKEKDAYDLADNLLDRDLDISWDDRRVCFECTNHVNKLCMAKLDRRGNPSQQLRFIPQRCDQFNLKGTKK